MTTRTTDAENALSFLRNPSLWTKAGTDDLLRNLFLCSVILGNNFSKSFLEEIRPFYVYITERTTVKQRLEILTRVAEAAEWRETGLTCHLPYLGMDEDPAVISTASLSLCVLYPPPDGDPLAGPKAVLRFTEAADTEASHAGTLQGILLLGDRRVLPLLDRCWMPLGFEGRQLLANAWSGFVYASTVDFLLNWLERTDDEGDYGAVAGVLAGYPLRRNAYPFVVDIERKFPANGPGDDPPIRRLGQWTFEEYGSIIAPRLMDIAEKETGDRVVPLVLSAWGIA